MAAVTGSALGRYQTAVIRMGFALTWLFFLIREFPHRRELYGPDGPWSWELAGRLIENNQAFTVLMWSDSLAWFELVYLLAIASAAALLVGWRTRTMSVLFMVGVLSLQNRSVFVGDGGDNVIHLMALYLVLTRCGQVWSLDARRERRRTERRENQAIEANGANRANRVNGKGVPQNRSSAHPTGPTGPTGPIESADPSAVALWVALGLLLAALQLLGFADLPWWDRGPLPKVGWFPGIGWGAVLWGLWLIHGVWWAVRRFGLRETRAVLDILTNLAHNAALLLIIAEVCLIYATAGWYKIQGTRWQDGTALYYPTHLDYFTPWPSLSAALSSNGLLTLLITYGTVLVQVAFPFALFNRRVKNVLLCVMIADHFSIAVVMGLPFFSLAMITADAVFLPTAFLLWLSARTRRIAARAGVAPVDKRRHQQPPAPLTETTGTPATGTPEDSRTSVS